MRTASAEPAAIELVEVGAGGGALALTHRPKRKAFAAFAAAGVTHVVTLLSEREGAEAIGADARAAGLTWIWIPFAGGDPPAPERDAELRAALAGVARVIADGGKVVVHCSAGIHRTGMVGHAILRQLGLASDAARATLARLRAVTADGVGDDRLAWGDRLADG